MCPPANTRQNNSKTFPEFFYFFIRVYSPDCYLNSVSDGKVYGFIGVIRSSLSDSVNTILTGIIIPGSLSIMSMNGSQMVHWNMAPYVCDVDGERQRDDALKHGAFCDV